MCVNYRLAAMLFLMRQHSVLCLLFTPECLFEFLLELETLAV